MGVVVEGLDDVSLEVEMGLDDLLVEYVSLEVIHESVIVGVDDQLHLLQASKHGVADAGHAARAEAWDAAVLHLQMWKSPHYEQIQFTMVQQRKSNSRYIQ
jgi:hypothetical protein